MLVAFGKSSGHITIIFGGIRTHFKYSVVTADSSPFWKIQKSQMYAFKNRFNVPVIFILWNNSTSWQWQQYLSEIFYNHSAQLQKTGSVVEQQFWAT